MNTLIIGEMSVRFEITILSQILINALNLAHFHEYGHVFIY